MDLIGHIKVIEDAGLSKGRLLNEEEILYAMFPNIAHCHEWAYQSLWNAHTDSNNNLIRILQGHMICDYVIHYGPDYEENTSRIGWAYKEMPRALEMLDLFVEESKIRGFLEMDPRLTSDKDRFIRDFGHTAVECALDFSLAEDFSGTDRLNNIRSAFQKLGREERGNKFIEKVFKNTSGYTKEPLEKLLTTVDSYSNWSEKVKSPEEFAAFTLIEKYGLVDSTESLNFCVSFLKDLSDKLNKTKIDSMLYEITERVYNPNLAFQGR
ncbi:hypothetical protein [Oceanobacillus sp. 1P07AA]|uniref:hypothetical protein n=1 Tax=Oceanobacillus sp. 1P07AA TaxID=3132293 RepID=UPI0039A7176C